MDKKGRIQFLEMKFGFKCQCVGCTNPIQEAMCFDCINDAYTLCKLMKESIGANEANKAYKTYIAEISRMEHCRCDCIKKVLLLNGLKYLYNIPY